MGGFGIFEFRELSKYRPPNCGISKYRHLMFEL